MRCTLYISLFILSFLSFSPGGLANPTTDLLHYVAVYEGDRPDIFFKKLDALMDSRNGLTWEAHSEKMEALGYEYPGRVRVIIKDTEAPIILILNSYEPTVWTLELARGVELKKIYLTSYYRSSVVQADGIPIETCFLVDDCEEYFCFYENESKQRYLYDNVEKRCSKIEAPRNEYQKGMKHIQEKFLRKPDSLQGTYTGKNFLIDKDSRVDTLKVIMEPGYCYKDKYGKLQPYGLEYEEVEVYQEN